MKPKLVIIHNRLVIGGPALDTIPLAHYLQNDFEVHILYGCKERDETEPSFLLNKYEGLTLVNIPSFKRRLSIINDIKSYLFLKKYIKRVKPKIVHTHGAKAGLFGRVAGIKAQTPLIVHTFHGHLFHSYFNRFFSFLYIFLERRLAVITDVIIALSESQKEELQKTLRITNSGKIKMIPLGVDYIDASMRDHYRQAFKRTYKVRERIISVGFLGRMVAIKNPLFFLEVARNVLMHGNDRIKFFVIGDGDQMPVMKRYLEQNNIAFSENHDESPVTFTSWIQNIQNVLDGLDIVVLTSYNEGTPLSLIEAQLCGKPVVAVDVGGVKDTMINGETGLLIPEHNVEQFSKAIFKLANDEVLRNEMGKKAKEFATAKFSKEKEVAETRSVYMLYKTK